MEERSNGGGDEGGAVELQFLEGGGPSSSGGGGDGTFEEGRYDGDRLRARLVALGDLEEKEPEEEEESQGEIFAQESDHLLNIFPLEIWVMILENVKNVKTKENLHYASPYFRNLLLPQREVYLFPAVWNILSKKFEKHHSNDHSYNETQVPDSGTDRGRPIRICENCSRRRKTKWYSGILTLRLVCRAWIAAVDKSLEDPVTRGATSLNDWTFSELPTRRLFQFFQHFVDTHLQSERNPLLGPHDAIINMRNDEQDFQNFLLRVVLVNFGQHINSMSFTDSFRQNFFLPATYQTLRSSLSSMRNLKVLKIQSLISTSPFLSMSQALAELQVETHLNPLPSLDNLQHLTCHSLPTLILNELLHRSVNLQTLEVDQRRTIIGQRFYDLCIFSFPNLQELSIKLYAGNELHHFGLPVALPSLQKLCLEFQPDYDIPFPSIFRLLGSKFGDTLTDLDISLPKANGVYEKEIIWRESPSFRLNLPRLVHLKLAIWNFTSFDFLLPMRHSLETLDLCIYYETNGSNCQDLVEALVRSQAIHLLGFTFQLLASNIWRLFPNLQEVKICETVSKRGKERHADYLYTRDDWERRNAN